jgi:ABC-type transport system substrate-binding protein
MSFRTTRRAALKALAATPAATLAQSPPPAAKVLRYAFQSAETGFDPAQVSDLYSRYVTAHIFDSLYAYDHLARPFKIKPATADGFPEHSADYRVWTIRVRPGIFFADDPAFNGARRELTAQDYVYTLKRAFDPRWKSPSYAVLSELKFRGLEALRQAVTKDRQAFDYDRPVEGLRALDRYTLQISLENPQPRLLQLLADSSLYGAVAREVVEKYGDTIMAHPVGTGPFRLTDWRRSSKIVLERNPGYREHLYDAEPNADDTEGQAMAARLRGRRLPMVDRVEISIIEEQQPRWLSFLNGQQDFLDRLPNEFVNIAIPGGKLAPNLARRGIQMLRELGSDVTGTVFNMDDATVGGYTPEKVALRRAIGLATDVDKEIRLARRGQAIPAQSGVSPYTYGFDPMSRSENGEYNLARARALLDTYGYLDRDGDGWRENPDGTPLTIIKSTQPSQLMRQFDELLKVDMTALGVRIEFRSAKWPDNMKNARAGKYMMWSLGWGSAAPDSQPTLDLAASLHAGGQNIAFFRHKRFDEIHARTNVMPDGPERLALMQEANRIMTAYMPYKYHVHRIFTDLAQPWVTGYRRPPVWSTWWTYVDVDAEGQAAAQA